ncbi:MAG: hypothetical protein ACJAQT_001812 [Akkermansiaceae bacterium]|jgi:hypothetical protein
MFFGYRDVLAFGIGAQVAFEERLGFLELPQTEMAKRIREGVSYPMMGELHGMTGFRVISSREKVMRKGG